MFNFLMPHPQVHSCRRSASPPLVVVLALTALLTSSALAQQDSRHDQKLDIRSSVGDLHAGNDADAAKTGLPLYPGARPRHDDNKDKDSDSGNFAILTQAFGLRLVVAKYDSDAAPAKVVDYYRDKLKKYGKVVECHTREHGGDIDANSDGDDKPDHTSKPLKCEGDNTGPVTELKVGTENNQHLVAIEPSDKGAGSTFALVYLHLHGKQGEI